MPVRRPMRPQDLRGVVVEELDLSTDGRLAVVVRRLIERNRYVSHLFAIDLSSGREIPRPRQLTRGTIRDTWPRLCPDGHTLAFLRRDPADEDSVTSIALTDLRSGSIRMARTGAHGVVGELAWSPDGRRLAFYGRGRPAPVHHRHLGGQRPQWPVRAGSTATCADARGARSSHVPRVIRTSSTSASTRESGPPSVAWNTTWTCWPFQASTGA